MQNFVKDGQTITWTNGTVAAVKSGDPVIIAGGKACVATVDIAISGTGELMTEGVYRWPKASGLVIAQGDKLFWSGTLVTKTNTDKTLGIAHEAAGNGTTSVLVDIEDSQSGTQMTFIADEATVNATDLASAQALANALKTKLNALLAQLRATGQMAGS